MISRYKHNEIVWVDLENPTQDEIKEIANEFGLNPTVANDLLTPSSRPIVDDYGSYTYLILHFPITKTKENYGKTTAIQEVDFILGEKFIITNRYTVVDSLMEFSKVFTANSVLDKNKTEHAGHLFYHMVRGLYEEMSNRLEHVDDLLADSEEKIFKGEEKTMVVELSKLNRLLLHFNKAIAIHEEVLTELLNSGKTTYGEDFNRYLKGIFGEYLKVKATIENQREYIVELRETNDSLLTTKQNEIMKILTIVAFITFPLTLVTGIFGMNTIETPIVGINHDFWIIMGLMALLTFFMVAYFKLKKWI
jgi:magnesium transporter